jgi:small subunit ribosomal protein S20
MANIKQAKKRARQNVKLRAHNMSLRSNMRTMIKSILKVIESKDHGKAMESFKKLTSTLDKLVNKKVIKLNKCSRLKKRINAKIKAIAA